MPYKKILHFIIGVKNIIIEACRIERKVKGEPNTDELIVRTRLKKRDCWRCPICGKKLKKYDNGTPGDRKWRGPDLMSGQKFYIEADIPRVNCPEHGVLTAKVPWARHGSRFTYSFEQLIAYRTMNNSMTEVSDHYRISWNTVGPVASRVFEDIKKNLPNELDSLEKIGIDETSYKKGHKYITIVVNHETATVIWVGEGHGKAVLTEFFELLTKEQREKIKLVSGDGASWIQECMNEYVPNALKCMDPFHTVAWATDTLNETRKRIHRELIEKEKTKKDKSKDDMQNGDKSNDDESNDDKKKKKKKKKSESDFIKEIRYAFNKGTENLTENQINQLEILSKSNPVLFRAYKLKEGLRL
jgi:transposase